MASDSLVQELFKLVFQYNIFFKLSQLCWRNDCICILLEKWACLGSDWVIYVDRHVMLRIVWDLWWELAFLTVEPFILHFVIWNWLMWAIVMVVMHAFCHFRLADQRLTERGSSLLHTQLALVTGMSFHLLALSVALEAHVNRYILRFPGRGPFSNLHTVLLIVRYNQQICICKAFPLWAFFRIRLTILETALCQNSLLQAFLINFKAFQLLVGLNQFL